MTALDLSGLLRAEAPDLALGPERFHPPAALERWREEIGSRRLVEALRPPRSLRAERTAEGVRLRWRPPEGLDAVKRRVADLPHLDLVWRVYRWRPNERPRLVAEIPIEESGYLDRELGPAGGKVAYSVFTALKGRVGGRETLIQSESSEVIEVEVPDRNEVVLVGLAAEEPPAVRLLVRRVGRPEERAEFVVRPGEEVGGVVRGADGALDLRTGFTLARVEIRPVERRVKRKVPVFEPDGSRVFDPERGFLFREEVRTIPARRLEVTLERPGETRVLEMDLPAQ